MNPKKNIINTIISQHLTGRGLTNTYRQFQEEINENMNEPLTTEHHKFLEDRYRQIKDQILGAFQDGDDKNFFSLRETLFEDLNYYKRDFKQNLDLDI